MALAPPLCADGLLTATATNGGAQFTLNVSSTAVIEYAFSFSVAQPTCPMRQQVSCFWGFTEIGAIAGSTPYGVFYQVSGDVTPLGNDVEQTGQRNGTLSLPVGTYSIDLFSSVNYSPDLIVVDPGSSLTLSMIPVSGAFSVAPVSTPEPASWLMGLPLLGLGLSIRGYRMRSLRRASRACVQKSPARPN